MPNPYVTQRDFGTLPDGRSRQAHVGELVTRPESGPSCVPSSDGGFPPMHTPLAPTEIP